MEEKERAAGTGGDGREGDRRDIHTYRGVQRNLNKGEAFFLLTNHQIKANITYV